MRARTPRPLAAAASALALLAGTACSGGDDEPPPRAGSVADFEGPVSLDGELASGATWKIEAPEGWNGVLLVFSHGYLEPGADNVAQLGPDTTSAAALLAAGYALAGSSFASTGWAVAEGLEDQLAVVDLFEERVAPPEHTIAWGGSMGALMTVALLEQHPDRFDGGVAACGVLAGAVAYWDQVLDVAHGLRTLLAPDRDAQLTGITRDQSGPQQRLQDTVLAAATTPEGAARIALVAALAGMPGSTTTTALAEVQAADLVMVAQLGGTARAELEDRFGGNPSSTAADPAALLEASPRRDEVRAAYAAAGADLDADLGRLAASPVAADPDARERLAAAYSPTGELQDPLLTLHTTRDPFAVLANERAYGERVDAAGAGDLLRHTTTERYGHCTFLPNEVVPVVEALVSRVEVGRWPALDAGSLNDAALALAGALGQTTAPAFTTADLPISPRFEADAVGVG